MATTEGNEQSPEELLGMILASENDKQLRICAAAIEAGRAASKCFMGGHEIEIDNLRAHIRSLSIALVDCVNGNPVDPSLYAVAVGEAQKNVVEIEASDA